MTLRTVLMVAADDPLRASVAESLAGRGYKVLTAETFAAGRRLLIEQQPDVLIAAVRLQEHNGLHLAIVSRLSSVHTKTIVLGYADPVLEAEAQQAGAIYLKDAEPADVVSAVEHSIERRERRWPRARANLAARADDHTVRLVDLSYGGFRIELGPGAKLTDGGRFDLSVGGIRVAAHPVWQQRSSNERTWCGAEVSASGEGYVAWRELVDTALNHATQ